MNIVYLKSFIKDIRKLKDPVIARKIEKLIKDLKAANSLEELSGVKKMKGYSTAYRIRIGSYRMGIYKEADHIEIARFLKRESIYKLFP